MAVVCWNLHSFLRRRAFAGQNVLIIKAIASHHANDARDNCLLCCEMLGYRWIGETRTYLVVIKLLFLLWKKKTPTTKSNCQIFGKFFFLQRFSAKIKQVNEVTRFLMTWKLVFPDSFYSYTWKLGFESGLIKYWILMYANIVSPIVLVTQATKWIHEYRNILNPGLDSRLWTLDCFYLN